MTKKMIGLDELSRYNTNIKEYINEQSEAVFLPGTIFDLTTEDTSSEIVTKLGGTDRINEMLTALTNHNKLIVGCGSWNGQDANLPATIVRVPNQSLGIEYLIMDSTLQGGWNEPRVVHFVLIHTLSDDTWSCIVADATGLVTQVNNLPVASSDNVGKLVLNYNDAHFYRCISTQAEGTVTYSWEKLNDLSNYLAKDNTTAFIPTLDYHPATKKYVDDSIAGSGGGSTTIPTITLSVTQIVSQDPIEVSMTQEQQTILENTNNVIIHLDATSMNLVELWFSRNHTSGNDLVFETIGISWGADNSGPHIEGTRNWVGIYNTQTKHMYIINTPYMDSSVPTADAHLTNKKYVDSKAPVFIPGGIFILDPNDSSATIVTKLGGQDNVDAILSALENNNRTVIANGDWGTQHGHCPLFLLSYTMNDYKYLYIEGLLKGEYQQPTYLSIQLKLNLTTEEWSVVNINYFNLADLRKIPAELELPTTNFNLDGSTSAGTISSDDASLLFNLVNDYVSDGTSRQVLLTILDSNNVRKLFRGTMSRKITTASGITTDAVTINCFDTAGLLLTLSFSKVTQPDESFVLAGNYDCLSLVDYNSLLSSVPYLLSSITGYDDTKTQVLKNVQGTLTWVDE